MNSIITIMMLAIVYLLPFILILLPGSVLKKTFLGRCVLVLRDLVPIPIFVIVIYRVVDIVFILGLSTISLAISLPESIMFSIISNNPIMSEDLMNDFRQNLIAIIPEGTTADNYESKILLVDNEDMGEGYKAFSLEWQTVRPLRDFEELGYVPPGQIYHANAHWQTSVGLEGFITNIFDTLPALVNMLPVWPHLKMEIFSSLYIWADLAGIPGPIKYIVADSILGILLSPHLVILHPQLHPWAPGMLDKGFNLDYFVDNPELFKDFAAIVWNMYWRYINLPQPNLNYPDFNLI